MDLVPGSDQISVSSCTHVSGLFWSVCVIVFGLGLVFVLRHQDLRQDARWSALVQTDQQVDKDLVWVLMLSVV